MKKRIDRLARTANRSGRPGHGTGPRATASR